MVTPDSKVVVVKTCTAGTVDGNVIILEAKREMYYSLDYVGAFIWGLIQTPRSVAEICDAVMTEYTVGREECEADVLELLNDMLAHEIITLADA